MSPSLPLQPPGAWRPRDRPSLVAPPRRPRGSSEAVGALLLIVGSGTASCSHDRSPAGPRVAVAAPATDAAAEIAPGSSPVDDPTDSGEKRTKVTAETSAMGTRIRFIVLTSDRSDEAHTRAAIEEAIAEIRRLEALMTTWRDDSEVSKINASAGRAPVRVSRETLGVIEKSLWISRLSGGLFDITFEVMHGLWRFDEDIAPVVPDASAVAARRAWIDYRHVIVDPGASTVYLDRPRTKISLGGIAKGYAIDRASDILLAAGNTDFMAQAGGDLYVHGRRADGSPWTAGVRDPRGPAESYFARMAVMDHAFSTAGDYERSYVVGGKRYHHIIDPRTGYPATASRSVTIWAKDAFTADALDDAVFILGPAKGMELVESIDDAGAIIVDGDNHVFISPRLAGKVTVDRPPTDGI